MSITLSGHVSMRLDEHGNDQVSGKGRHNDEVVIDETGRATLCSDGSVEDDGEFQNSDIVIDGDQKKIRHETQRNTAPGRDAEQLCKPKVSDDIGFSNIQHDNEIVEGYGEEGEPVYDSIRTTGSDNGQDGIDSNNSERGIYYNMNDAFPTYATYDHIKNIQQSVTNLAVSPSLDSIDSIDNMSTECSVDSTSSTDTLIASDQDEESIHSDYVHGNQPIPKYVQPANIKCFIRI